MDKVYDNISTHFDRTRYSIWSGVKDFLDKIQQYSIIADIGCGNGKNARYRKDIVTICNDISIELLKISNSKKDKYYYDCIMANGLNLPYRNNLFDAVISIAVLHHIDNYNDRLNFIKELIRITKPNHKILITVWADEQKKKAKWILINGCDYLIPWEDRNGNIINRYYHFFSKKEIEQIMNEIGCEYTLHYELDNWFIICTCNIYTL
jgi:SAM-dependent methyltransferase